MYRRLYRDPAAYEERRAVEARQEFSGRQWDGEEVDDRSSSTVRPQARLGGQGSSRAHTDGDVDAVLRHRAARGVPGNGMISTKTADDVVFLLIYPAHASSTRRTSVTAWT